MEQLKDPRSLISAAQFRHRANDTLPVELEEVAPSRSVSAWARLTEVYVDPRELKRQKVHGLDTRSAISQIDILRTKTLNYMRSNGFKCLGISSPNRGCGKTTIAANLAMSLARQQDLRTMLFDFDLPNPELITRFG
ncbi:MAG: hypothetical protein HKP40_02355, partial [Litoreibacter sp.]|nr:hypothetical protein [Litoreibacter sp.]